MVEWKIAPDNTVLKKDGSVGSHTKVLYKCSKCGEWKETFYFCIKNKESRLCNSCIRIGVPQPNVSKALLGTHLSEEHRQNISKALLGTHLSEEHRQNISKAKLGTHLSEEHRQNVSKALLGTHLSEEHRQNISKAKLGKPLSEKNKQGIRTTCIRNGYQHPQYNYRSCEFFEKFDNLNHRKGRYGYRETEQLYCGFPIDYSNDKISFLIEWNEGQHYDSNGFLSIKDIQKCDEILQKFPNYTYIIINQVDLEKGDFSSVEKLKEYGFKVPSNDFIKYVLDRANYDTFVEKWKRSNFIENGDEK